MNNIGIKTSLIILILAMMFASCDQNKVYDTYVDLENGIWKVDTLPTYNFEIEDETVAYNISYNIRYAEVYPYYNLYMKYFLEDSLNNIIGSELQEILLFDKKTGTPLGEGLGDIFDREVLIFEDFKFPARGNYTFKVKQFMRVDNLPGIMSFGLKIDKPVNEE